MDENGYFNSDTKTYSGGLGLVQKGKADILALNVDYPMKTQDFGYTQPIQSDRPHIGSCYNKTTTQIDLDILDMIHTFNKYDWMCVAGVLIVFFLLFKFAQKKVYGVKEPQALWVVTMFFIDQDYIHEVTHFLKVFSCVMSFFSFFVLNWLEGNMSTDLVSVSDPKAVLNYKQMIDYDVQPLFMKGHPEIDAFHFARDGTVESAVWKHASKNGADFWIRPDPSGAAENLLRYIRQKIAIISRYANVLAGSYFLCSQVRDPEGFFFHPDTNGLISKDEASIEIISTLVYNTNVSLFIKEDLNKRTLAFVEFGMVHHTVTSMVNGFIPYSTKIEECINYKPLKTNPGWQAIQVQNMGKVIMMFFLFAGISFIVLLWETFHQQKKSQKKWAKKRLVRKAIRKE